MSDEPLLSLLTPTERRAGIAEAMARAITEFPEMGHDGVGVAATWSQKTGAASVGVLVQVGRVNGGLIAEKTYDDLKVIAVARVRLGGT